jgi:hypothetical protein
MTGLPPLQLEEPAKTTAQKIISVAEESGAKPIQLETKATSFQESPDEKAEAAGIAPSTPVAPVEKPKPKTPEVDEESFGKFLQLIASKEQECIRFLRQFPEGQKSWLGANDSLPMISKGNLAWILKKPEAFMKRLNDFLAKEAK